LGLVDLYGGNFTDDIVTTGYGTYIGLPLLRKNYRPNMTDAEAKQLLEDTMRVLFYRDCRALNRVIHYDNR